MADPNEPPEGTCGKQKWHRKLKTTTLIHALVEVGKGAVVNQRKKKNILRAKETLESQQN